MAGKTLKEQNAEHEVIPPYYSVKEAVFPFRKFPGVDPILGPEMKSTGEVMGVGDSFGEAFLKAQYGSSVKLPRGGHAFISVRDPEHPQVAEIAKHLHELGFKLFATSGTARNIDAAGVPVTRVNKVAEGRPHIVDMIKNKDIHLIINVVEDKRAVVDSFAIRAAALAQNVPYFTTLAGAKAACLGMKDRRDITVYSLQELHQRLH
jgi:carbamoyl-phosphate synthase large subunit